ncbi:2-deoxyribose-5-phosphate aldolase [Sphaerimonospora sp. CA-214678]|uniref:2-deoxyribose-5-phosphate aldolase n=1 Tax=Sphaerimonospora sp. CA-214678 TaxID=3240029 RepID=UPI003D89E24A
MTTPLAEVATSNASLRAFLHGLPGVDRVGADARAAMLGTRSIKTTAKRQAIDLAVRMVDLTTLEGADTPGKVRAMCAKAVRPDPADASVPPVAAVCVYPDLVATAVQALRGTDVKVASVATAFPSGRSSLEVKVAETRFAVAAGAAEVDMVIDRGAFLAGDYLKVFEEIAAVRAACGRVGGVRDDNGAGGVRDENGGGGAREEHGAHLKVILETGELATYDNVRRASWLAMLAGADFIKTSTGKVSPAATLPVTLIMLEAVRDFARRTGRKIGVKPAGGIRTTKDAIKYLVLVNETAGPDRLTPDLFRLGASSLLNDLLMQRQKMATGRYAGPDYFTLD